MRRVPIKYDECMAHARTHATQRGALTRKGLVYRYIASREPSEPPPPDRKYLAFEPRRTTSTTPYPQGVQASLLARPMPLQKSLGRSNLQSSKASQASYDPRRCNLFHLSLPLPVFGRLFLFPHPRDQIPAAPFAYTVPRLLTGRVGPKQWN